MTTMSDVPEPVERETLLEFPCRFPIKAMGRQSEEFETTVTEIVFRHAEMWPGEDVQLTPSRAGNFVSVTTIIEARSQSQLDAIYQELSDCALVIMAL
jgi:putative lipoic acid-binding regulatory protein